MAPSQLNPHSLAITLRDSLPPRLSGTTETLQGPKGVFCDQHLSPPRVTPGLGTPWAPQAVECPVQGRQPAGPASSAAKGVHEDGDLVGGDLAVDPASLLAV